MEELDALKELYDNAIDGLKRWKCGPQEEEERQVKYVDLRTDYNLLLKLIEEKYDEK